MNAKRRKWGLYEEKPQHIAHATEALPKSPAKKPYSGYCKRLKGEHVFDLDDVTVWNHRSHPQGWQGPCYVVALIHYKTYRCIACDKKKIIREEMKLDEPVLEKEVA